jgi:hypothetical protein
VAGGTTPAGGFTSSAEPVAGERITHINITIFSQHNITII